MITGFIAIQENIIFCILLQSLFHLIIIIYRDTSFLKVSTNLTCKLSLIYKKRHLIRCNQEITNEYRIAMHIRTTQVQGPGNIIECRHQHTISMNTSQSLSDPSYLRNGCLTGKIHRLNFHRIFRNSRTIFPYLLQWIKISAQGNTTLLTQIRDKCRGH